jgi:hypothetical protein
MMLSRDDGRGRFEGGVMNRRKRNLFWIVGLIMPVIMLSACAPKKVSLMRVTPLTSTSMVIYSAMTRDYSGSRGTLNIYLDANGFPESITPASGQEEPELKATLWLQIVDHPETYNSILVHAGQTVPFEGYKIEVLRIGKDDRNKYFVEVEVIETK